MHHLTGEYSGDDAINDTAGRTLILCASPPQDCHGIGVEITKAIEQFSRKYNPNENVELNNRGNFGRATFGVSFGGGQKVIRAFWLTTRQ